MGFGLKIQKTFSLLVFCVPLQEHFGKKDPQTKFKQTQFSFLESSGLSCLIPPFDGVILSLEWKEALVASTKAASEQTNFGIRNSLQNHMQTAFEQQ